MATSGSEEVKMGKQEGGNARFNEMWVSTAHLHSSDLWGLLTRGWRGMRPEQSAIKKLFFAWNVTFTSSHGYIKCGSLSHLDKTPDLGNAADKEPYCRLIKWFCLKIAVTLTWSLLDTFTNQFWPRIGFNQLCRWLNLCYLCLSRLHRWALAHHMAASEQFVCAICSQLAIETFCLFVTRQCWCDDMPALPTAKFWGPKQQYGFQTSELKPANCNKVVCQIKSSTSVPGENNAISTVLHP